MIRSTAHRVLPSAAAALLMAALIAGCSTPAASPTADPGASPTAVEPSAPVSTSPSPSSPGLDPDAVAAVRESLAASISSGNTAALEGYLTDPVLVTLAATEFQESMTPAEAVPAVDYVIDLTATWNFALPEATLELYRAGSYTQHFPADALVGLSSAGAVIAFTMVGAESSAIFMCIDEGLLLP